MPHSEARAWWAEVQHLKDDYERTDEARRRADEADLASRRAMRERRDVDAEVSSVGGAERSDPIAQRRDTTFSARRGTPTAGSIRAAGTTSTCRPPRACARASRRRPRRSAARA